MKKRLFVLLGLALILGLIVALALPTSHFVIMGWLRRESFYQDRPTSYWISAMKKDAFLGSSAPADVGKLLREGGEAAVPVLKEMLIDEDDEVAGNALLILHTMAPRPKGFTGAVIAEMLKRRTKQSYCFQLATTLSMRADRQTAVDALVGVLREHKDADSRAWAASTLEKLASTAERARLAPAGSLKVQGEADRLAKARALWRNS